MKTISINEARCLIKLPNYVYRIDNNIDLEGEPLILPSNIVLDFQGGRFINSSSNLGKIYGVNTLIINETNKSIGENISLVGTWRNFGSLANAPTGTMIDGTMYYYSDNSVNTHKPLFWFDGNWYDADGYSASVSNGSTDNRPVGKHTESQGGVDVVVGSLTTNDLGFVYFDRTIRKHISVSSVNNISGEVIWKEYDGASAGVARSGEFANRPSFAEAYVGFSYFCTDFKTPESSTLGAIVNLKSVGVWVDALGREIASVTNVLTNITALTIGAVPKTTTYKNKLIADSGYTLPAAIIVKMSDITLTNGTDYTYDNSTGEIEVLGTGGSGGVTGNLYVKATGVANS